MDTLKSFIIVGGTGLLYILGLVLAYDVALIELRRKIYKYIKRIYLYNKR